ncbi:MAG: efflux transporter outer membrane subunit [Akkermansiaceae bacterium]|nr:efflux transporter outer membrane subunit [Akkermansiaceae bacterium]
MYLFRSHFLLIPVSLWLGGCTLPTPSGDASMELPVAWKNAGAFPVASPSRDLARWWGHFEDPLLNRLIADALKANPDVSMASARVRESRSRLEAERASLFPYVGGSASGRSGTTHTDRAGTTSSTSYSAGLDASWEADLFGQRRSTLEAAAANLGGSEETLHSVQAALAAEIATAYTGLRANEARLDVLRRNIATREQTADLATWRLQAGEADSLESNQALSSLESARAGVPALQQAISQGRNTLALLSGLNPGSLDGTLAAGRKQIPNPSRKLAIGIPADVVRQRPDVRVAGYQLLSAAANTRAADAARYPSLSLSGSIGLTALRAGKIFNPETTSANIVAGLSAPIFDAGRLRANLAATTAAEDQAIDNYKATVLTALSESENALIACSRTAERLATLEKATALAREADLLARQRYEAGEIDFSDVLDTQRSLLGLEDSLLNTRTDRTNSYIRLYQALGGGWSS